MPGLFFPHSNMTELDGKEGCKLAEGKTHKKKHKAFGADLKSYLKSMVPHIESGIKTSNCRNIMLSAEEVIQWSQSLEKLLASQSGQGVFREFLKSEFSEENIEFWLACEDYKKTRSDHLHSKAERIYKEFVQSDAVKQINIDYRMREATAKRAQEATHTSFDEAQKTVYVLMERDSYPRFLKSRAYLNLLNQLQSNSSK
ncbi:RGS1 protein, partial [Rhinopomastus cyanomelas]|nr:RGS1 protein [Rhinopomastus cyanomelas]